MRPLSSSAVPLSFPIALAAALGFATPLQAATVFLEFETSSQGCIASQRDFIPHLVASLDFEGINLIVRHPIDPGAPWDLMSPQIAGISERDVVAWLAKDAFSAPGLEAGFAQSLETGEITTVPLPDDSPPICSCPPPGQITFVEAIPESSTLLLGGVGAFGLLRRRRNQ